MSSAAITQHAIDRYMERSGSKAVMRTIRKLFDVVERGVPVNGGRFYHKGWIVVVRAGEIKTVYRPRTKAQMSAVYDAHKRRIR